MERGVFAGRRHHRGIGAVAPSADHHGRAGFLLHAAAGDCPGRDRLSPGRRSLLLLVFSFLFLDVFVRASRRNDGDAVDVFRPLFTLAVLVARQTKLPDVV